MGRLDDVSQCVGNLGGHFLLNLGALAYVVDNSIELGEANDLKRRK